MNEDTNASPAKDQKAILISELADKDIGEVLAIDFFF